MSFAKAGSQTLFFRILLLSISALTTIIQARFLGPEGMGILVLLVTIKRLAFSFGNLGFGSSFAFFIAQNRTTRDEALKVAWLVGTLLSVIAIMAFIVIRPLSFSPWNDIAPYFFYSSMLSVPLIFYISFHQRILSGELRINEINISELVCVGTNCCFLVIALIFLQLGIIGAIVSMLLSDLITFVYLSLRLHIPRTLFLLSEFRSTFKYSLLLKDYWSYGKWNYIIMLVNITIDEMPRLFLKVFTVNNTDIGLLSAARNLSQESRLVAIPIAQVLFPYTAASKEEVAIRRTNILCRNSVLLMLIVSLIAGILAKPLILLFYGSEFLVSVPIFWAMLPAMIVFPLNHFVEIHLAASGYPKEACTASASSLVFGILLSAILIPQFEVIGAAVTISGIALVRTISRLWIYNKVTGVSCFSLLVPIPSDISNYKTFLRMLLGRIIPIIKQSTRMPGE